MNKRNSYTFEQAKTQKKTKLEESANSTMNSSAVWVGEGSLIGPLNQHMIFSVFMFLSDKEVWRLGELNKTFYSITRADWIWRAMIRRDLSRVHLREEVLDTTIYLSSDEKSEERNTATMLYRKKKAIYTLPAVRWWKPLEIEGLAGPRTPQSYPAARECHAATKWGPWLVVCGGFCSGDPVLRTDVWLLDTRKASARWVKAKITGVTPPERYGHSLTLVPPLNGLVLFGGLRSFGYVGEQNDLWLLKLSLGAEVTDADISKCLEWTRLAYSDKVTPRGFHSATYVPSTMGEPERFIVFGGISDGVSINDISSLDLKELLWTSHLSETSSTQQSEASQASSPSSIEVCGQLRNTAGPPAPRYGHSCTYHNGRLYIIGGANGGNMLREGTDFRDVHIFDVINRVWLDTKDLFGQVPLRAGGRCHCAALVYDNIVLFAGHLSMTNDVHVFNIPSLSWHSPRVLGPKPSRRLSSVAVFDTDRLLIFGGWSNSRPTGDFHVLDLMVWNPSEAEAQDDPSCSSAADEDHRQPSSWMMTGGTLPLNWILQFLNASQSLNDDDEEEEEDDNDNDDDQVEEEDEEFQTA